MSNPMSELFSNVDAQSCMEMARRYYRFAEAARCETVRQALEDTARFCARGRRGHAAPVG